MKWYPANQESSEWLKGILERISAAATEDHKFFLEQYGLKQIKIGFTVIWNQLEVLSSVEILRRLQLLNPGIDFTWWKFLHTKVVSGNRRLLIWGVSESTLGQIRERKFQLEFDFEKLFVRQVA